METITLGAESDKNGTAAIYMVTFIYYCLYNNAVICFQYDGGTLYQFLTYVFNITSGTDPFCGVIKLRKNYAQ